ncbi:TPA: DNA-binding response regulator [Bacillus thuringiensis]|nr:DNA-binding response regulator [Bacillus thuringiensis]HDR6319764.1 DNA-binding response regulator [Bacillus thuringiensis]
MQKTILIVEDEDILREIMKDYLLNEGYNVLEAIDRKEALSIFEEHEVHLMMLDIMLPELDDRTINSHIRNIRHKLGQKAACIVTVVRAGYKIEGQV